MYVDTATLCMDMIDLLYFIWDKQVENDKPIRLQLWRQHQKTTTKTDNCSDVAHKHTN